MKNGFKDYRRILFYTVLGIGIGMVVGAVDTLFGRMLRAITSFREEHVMMLVPFLPAAGIITLWLFQKISPESQKGMTLIFETGVEKNEKIPKALVPLIMVTTWMTHLFGGSAGRVGVTMQVGATISHTIGRILKRKGDEKIFLIIGIAAGFSGLFQTPLAATFLQWNFWLWEPCFMKHCFLLWRRLMRPVIPLICWDFRNFPLCFLITFPMISGQLRN